MTKTFAIADTHGRSDLMKLAFEIIEKELQPGDKIITLGDYIDRGPDSKGVIQFLRNYQKEHPGTLICLMGNHEDMMLQVLQQPTQGNVNWWVVNGGGQTLVSYGHHKEGSFNPSVIDIEDLTWLVELPLSFEDVHRVFVHAGVDRYTTMEQQSERDMLWKIYRKRDDDYEGGYQEDLTSPIKHIVHGHEQHDDVIHFQHRTDLDAFAWYRGKLAIGVFDDEKSGGPTQILWAEGKSYEQLSVAA